MSLGEPTPESLSRQAVARLTELGRTVAVAESLTGGLVIASLIGVPGASAVVRGGVVAYVSDLKASLLGVDVDLLARVGAVDPEVARQMAIGVAARLGADYGVATTGVAGPDAADGRPVGVVHVAVTDRGALADLGTMVGTRRFEPALGREGIRRGAVVEALALLVHLIDTTDPG